MIIVLRSEKSSIAVSFHVLEWNGGTRGTGGTVVFAFVTTDRKAVKINA